MHVVISGANDAVGKDDGVAYPTGPTVLPRSLQPFFDAKLMTPSFWKSARYHRDRVEHRWWDADDPKKVFRLRADAGSGADRLHPSHL